MRRHHHRSALVASEDDSSSDEDAFAALSRKKSGRPSKENNTNQKGQGKKRKESEKNVNVNVNASVNNTSTSSNKRHHHHSSARAAKMENLLQELHETSKSAPKTNSNSNSERPPPDKMGSFVTADDEPFTTNIFVGNLSPLTTEEQLTDIFRQFGDLYSVKIMWPRTPEEHARGRNTGFVCFMNRDDAQEAMNAYQERDPLRSGRRMFLRWGKNVKKTVKRGTGGVPIPPIRKKVADPAGVALTSTSKNDTHNNDGVFDTTAGRAEKKEPTLAQASSLGAMTIQYDETKHSATAIRVITPTDTKRLKFITTLASFVAKDGSLLEKRIIERESNNPLFSFLHSNHGHAHEHEHSLDDSKNMNERIFYRWRVYAFTQGDGVDSWRTDPFIMIQPNGRFWIPPKLDTEKALREKMEKELKEDNIRIQQERRRKVSNKKKDFATGRRQLESSTPFTKTDKGITTQLHLEDLEYWNHMIENKLCISRDTICEVMAFCFDKSAAAQHISQLLKDLLMDSRKGVSVETKIARLYLMSDILYNSQQPGVKNAFRYRDAIEGMAHEVFKCLGTHGNGSFGRMTMNKLRNAVKAVLFAWAKWSVYNVAFLNELEALFEGKSIEKEKDENKEETSNEVKISSKEKAIKSECDAGSQVVHEDNFVVKKTAPMSIWVDKTESEAVNDVVDIDGEDLDEEDIESATMDIDDDLDGESLHESDMDEEDMQE